MQNTGLVVPFSPENFIDIITDLLKESDSLFESTGHIGYLADYLDEIEAKTIVIERDYIDNDFLEDHSGFYVKCYRKYRRKTTRLHFFGVSFSDSQFASILEGASVDISIGTLDEEYKGFIVIKPLPRTIIGRTCVSTYSTKGTNRQFPIVRDYESNLYGIALHVDSLAFQEQDKVAAACATSALWSTFHASGKTFQHKIPSPVEITQLATEIVSDYIPRALPNEGLTITQILHAIRRIAMEPLILSVDEEYDLKSILYAYIKCSIPLVLVFELWDMSGEHPKSAGDHAVTITGFNLSHDKFLPYGKTKFLLYSSQIGKIYVHDDQVGPFARMNFDGLTVPKESESEIRSKKDLNEESNKESDDESDNERYSLTTDFMLNDQKKRGLSRAAPHTLIIPLHDLIRISFALIKATILNLDAFLKLLSKSHLFDIEGEFYWDIHLSTVNQYKKEVIIDPGIDPSERYKTLKMLMPKFIWRATGYSKSKKAIELLFDATDIEQGKVFLGAVKIDVNLFDYLEIFSEDGNLITIFEESIPPEEFTNTFSWVLKWFAKQH